MLDKQTQLQGFLRRLAKKETKISVHKHLQELQSIYADDFRHLYSDVFGVITRIDDEQHESLEILSINIKELYRQALEERQRENSIISSDVCRKIEKLYDHVNLDIARINYTRRIANELNKKHTDFSRQLEIIKSQAEHTQRDMQKDYITILGIFASIVVTFVAGMAFSTSILSNIEKASIYRLVFVISLLGLGLFNLVNLLLRHIQSINQGYNLKNDENTERIGKINEIILLIIIADFIAWLIYWFRFN